MASRSIRCHIGQWRPCSVNLSRPIGPCKPLIPIRALVQAPSCQEEPPPSILPSAGKSRATVQVSATTAPSAQNLTVPRTPIRSLLPHCPVPGQADRRADRTSWRRYYEPTRNYYQRMARAVGAVFWGLWKEASDSVGRAWRWIGLPGLIDTTGGLCM